jgi:hypothetical protein
MPASPAHPLRRAIIGCAALVAVLCTSAGRAAAPRLVKPLAADDGRLEFSLPAAGEARARRGIDWTDFYDVPMNWGPLTVCLHSFGPDREVGRISAVLVDTGAGGMCLSNVRHLDTYLKRKQVLWLHKDITIQSDSKIKYGFVIEAMDTCLNAGFTRVGFAPPPDLADVVK